MGGSSPMVCEIIAAQSSPEDVRAVCFGGCTHTQTHTHTDRRADTPVAQVIELIVSFLVDDGRSLAAAQRVCKIWRKAAQLENLWLRACAAAWPSTSDLAAQQLLPGGCRKFYAQRRLAEKQKLNPSEQSLAADELSLLLEVHRAGATVCSRQLRLSCDTADASVDLLLEDDEVRGQVDGSWEDWSEHQQRDGSWSISISVLRHADHKVALLATTPSLPRYRERVQPRARWGFDGMSGPCRSLIFGHSRAAPMPSNDAAQEARVTSSSVWDGRSLLQHRGPLPSSEYVIAPRLELCIRPSQGWLDPCTGIGCAELFSISLKFEAFGKCTVGSAAAAPLLDAMDDDEDGVPRPPSATLSNDDASQDGDGEAGMLADLDESDAGVELNAAQLGCALRDLCSWV